ncbi:hypothetical protein RUM44_010467 [Polyplax serrata]|uniref:Uncharacterized protein n=1 Tax=Polyplax serrata TaxID=468196 RepID=A0ABR1AVL7_POLSC
MIRPNATRTLALNGLTITATISQDDEAVFTRCRDKYCLEDLNSITVCNGDEYEEKCRKRQEYYDMRNREKKSIENSKDSLDLMYEKKLGIGKSPSVDLPERDRESLRDKAETIRQKRRRDGSLGKIERFDTSNCLPPVELYGRPDGIPRSTSDILDIQRRKIKKWTEVDFYRTANGRTSRRDNVFTLVPMKSSKSFVENVDGSKCDYECLEYQSVPVKEDHKDGRKCKSGCERDKIFRNVRSRSATIPRKWSEYSLTTPSTASGKYPSYLLLPSCDYCVEQKF